MWQKNLSNSPISASNKHIILLLSEPSPLYYIIAHRINLKMNYLLNSSMLKNTYSPLSIMLSSSAANSISLTVNGLAHTTITETERSTEISPWLKIRFRTYVYSENMLLLLLSRRVVVHYYWKTQISFYSLGRFILLISTRLKFHNTIRSILSMTLYTRGVQYII